MTVFGEFEKFDVVLSTFIDEAQCELVENKKLPLVVDERCPINLTIELRGDVWCCTATYQQRNSDDTVQINRCYSSMLVDLLTDRFNEEDEEDLWVNIPGFEGLYQVSSSGKVKSLARYATVNGVRKFVRERILKASTPDKAHYSIVGLCKDGKRKLYAVHRLVAETFIPNPDNLPEVNHKDQDKSNNSVENLEWCDRLHNGSWGTIKEKIATNQPNKKAVVQCDLLGNEIATYESAGEAERKTGIKAANIRNCCRGLVYEKDGYSCTVKKAGGYIWRYKE